MSFVATDQGERDAIKPFELHLRPAIISKAGKKRTHAPSDGDLKAAGLKLKTNPVQLHLGERDEPPNANLSRTRTNSPVSQRYTADGKRNVSVDRFDGPPPPKPKRVAQAKISTASRAASP
jgi:hypothetical protein